MADTHMKKIAVKITDIEQMILMADKVLDEVMMGSISHYDCDGVPFPREGADEQFEKDNDDGSLLLVYKTVHEKYETFEDVLAVTAEELEEKLKTIKKRVLGIFRTGVLEEWYRYMFYADDSVPDEWLFTMFLMIVRNRMIVFASQRMHDENKEKRLKKANK